MKGYTHKGILLRIAAVPTDNDMFIFGRYKVP